MTPAQVAHIMVLVEAYADSTHISSHENCLAARAAVEAALRDAPQQAEPPYPMASTLEGAAQDVAKWLNERPESPLDLRHVAMLVHAVQASAEAVEPSTEQSSVVEPRDERQDFEAAYRARYPVSCELDPQKFNLSAEGDYEDIRVSIAWAMWQARASKGTPK